MLTISRIIENNLCAVTKTSTIHQNELQKHIYHPNLLILTYDKNHQLRTGAIEPNSLHVVRQLYKEAKSQIRSEIVESKCKIVIGSSKASLGFIYTLFSKASAVNRNLGRWAADSVTRSFIGLWDDIDVKSETPCDNFANDEIYKSKLIDTIRREQSSDRLELSTENMSAKVSTLVAYLESAIQPDFKALIFAEQRIIVHGLAEILSKHPKLKNSLSVGTYVGLSAKQRIQEGSLGEVMQAADQQHVLRNFKAGKLNLIVATSVLEEGIDISSCQLVICFDPPRNLASFIQRRGRARQPDSKFIVIVPDEDSTLSKMREWGLIETQILKAVIERDIESESVVQYYNHQKRYNYEVLSTGYVPSLSSKSRILQILEVKIVCIWLTRLIA